MILDKQDKNYTVPDSGYTIIDKILIIWLHSVNSGYDLGVAWTIHKV